ncbi:hypothetical protein ACFODL_12550 [Phenylobacterium terrae]|uniref:Uncharacterized protein n=1 Tax=Phenylobacterium terrae TaxID=2665495 RepID=A0ABW4N289_9CAUL
MRHDRVLACAATGLLLAAPAQADAKCRFSYTPEFHETVVMPEVRRALEGELRDWDTASPTHSVRGRTVRVIVRMSERRLDIIDPPHFVVEIGNCGKGRVRAGLQEWDVALGMRRPTREERSRPGYLP